ncbi:PA2169 family four-helix-bundle protein [Dyella tabacisoli]|uniref:PA2169 family four-helix-bundle protein n=1 Tax=Dyella tabacisoli TaxID=2282381 RepID=A0A369UPS0_9GAMM|nr:PA2169 family four-helix-bundle protein [Dyella tabacisoli]RDD80329.1 PA2169 family four-helix-bundle protein [Dyella tabacisoli]
MSHTSHRLYNTLIRRGIDDRNLYRDAVSQVREPGLRALLSENAQMLDALIGDLQAQVRAGGRTPASHGTLAGSVHRAMTSMRARHSAHCDAAWVQGLASHECALLNCIERQIRHASAETVRVLDRQRSRLHGIHHDMHCLAGTTHS